MKKVNKLGLLGLVMGLGLFGLTACGQDATPTASVANPTPVQQTVQSQVTSQPNPAAKAQVGYLVPDFSGTNTNGQPTSLTALRGKAVVLNFWAIYCQYCEQELPDFIKAANTHQTNVSVVGINMNDDPGEVKKYISDHQIPFPVVIDDTGDLTFKYRVRGHPTTLFINKNGVITDIVAGLVEPQALEEEISKALK